LTTEAYLVGDKDGYYGLDRCNSAQDPYVAFTYGTCVYKDEIAKLQAARQTGTKVISVTTMGGAFSAYDYIGDVDAAFTMYYPGQYLADALASVLVGKHSPGGKLIATLPDLEADGKHIQSPIARFNAGLDITTTGGSTDDDACTPFDSDPWNTGVAIPCCEGTNSCVYNWNGDDNWFFICTMLGAENCPGEIKPQGFPVTPIDQCTAPGSDPYSSGSPNPRACCAGSDSCLHNWNGGDNYFFICTLSNAGNGACPGEIIPQGRLAKGGGKRFGLTAPAIEWDEGANAVGTKVQYGADTSVYSEKNLIGYKYFEKYNMKPLFPFGFGMSYQSPKLTVDFADSCASGGCSVTATVTGLKSDAGQIASEVIQVYVGYKSADSSKDTLRPVKELRAFKKVWNSGQSLISLKMADFETSWDVTKQAFVTPCAKDDTEGQFTVYVGTSSDNIVKTTTFACEKEPIEVAPTTLAPTNFSTATPTSAPDDGNDGNTGGEGNSSDAQDSYGTTMAYAVSTGVAGFILFAMVYNRHQQRKLDAKGAAEEASRAAFVEKGGPVLLDV
jgi:hypothetical protein